LNGYKVSGVINVIGCELVSRSRATESPGLGAERLLWLVGGLKPFLRRTLPVIKEIQNNNPVLPNGVKDAYLLDDYKSSDSFFFVFKSANIRKFTQNIEEIINLFNKGHCDFVSPFIRKIYQDFIKFFVRTLRPKNF
jgi:hypothetical protein